MKDLCFASFNKIVPMLLQENQNQLKKWGIQDRLPSEWIMFATEELGELAEAIGEWNYRCGATEDVVKEAIQVATLALKIAEMFSEA